MIYGSSNRVRPWIHLTETRGIRAPSQVRTMTSEQCAYIGAMLDAEGCVYYSHQYKASLPPHLDFANTEPKLINAIRSILGTGKVRAEHKKGERRPCLHVKISRLADVWSICRQVQPFSLKAQSAVSYLIDSYGVTP